MRKTERPTKARILSPLMTKQNRNGYRDSSGTTSTGSDLAMRKKKGNGYGKTANRSLIQIGDPNTVFLAVPSHRKKRIMPL